MSSDSSKPRNGEITNKQRKIMQHLCSERIGNCFWQYRVHSHFIGRSPEVLLVTNREIERLAQKGLISKQTYGNHSNVWRPTDAGRKLIEERP